MRRPPAEPGSKEWHDRTIAKLIALVRNSRSGRTFNQHFDADRKYLTQGELDSLLKTAVVYGKDDILTTVLEAGANPNTTMTKPMEEDSNEFMYCLGWACSVDFDETAKILLDHGADPELKDTEGKIAWDYCTPGQYARLANYIQSKNMLDTTQDIRYVMYDYEL